MVTPKSLNYITVEKVKRKKLGIDIYSYKIKLNHRFNCNNITVKKSPNPITKYIKNHPLVYNKFTHKRTRKIKKIIKDDRLTDKLIEYIKPCAKYTYCLTNDALIISDTYTKYAFGKLTESAIKNYTSKHYIICGDKICANGELVIKNNTFIFDNASGTYAPKYKQIKVLKKALPFLNIKIIDMKSPDHPKYFI